MSTPLFPLPTVAETRDAARLLPAQYDPKLTTPQFETDVQQFIAAANLRVEAELLQAAAPRMWPLVDSAIAAAFPEYSQEERTRWSELQSGNATEVVRLWAGASIIRESVQLNEAYEKRAESLEARGQAILDVLLSGIGFVTENATPGDSSGAAQSITPTRVDGYSTGSDCAEHTRCGRLGLPC